MNAWPGKLKNLPYSGEGCTVPNGREQAAVRLPVLRNTSPDSPETG
jgi:hypothetical protein